MAQTFGDAGDNALTTLTTHNVTRSYSIWTYRTGNGGGGFGRMFEKRTVSAAVENLANDNDGIANDGYGYQRIWSTGNALWFMPVPSANVWHNVIVTYDGGATTNDPVMYLDGVSQSITEDTAPSGTINTTTDAYVIGNRNTGTDRTWAGDLCEFAVWNRILTAAEASSIGARAFSPLFYPTSLVEYVPMVRAAISYKNAAPTFTGLVVAPHPRIIYPSPAQMRRFTTATAPQAAARVGWRSLLGVGI